MLKAHNLTLSADLEILLPGLFEGLRSWPENRQDVERQTALDWFLSHSNRSSLHVAGYEEALWRCFDPDLENDDELPVAALRTDWMKGALCADPAHLQIGVTDVELLAGPDLMLSETDRHALSELLNELLQAEGIRFVLDENGWGTLLLDRSPDIRTTPLSAVSGSMLAGKIPAGPEKTKWNRLGNEIQMLLHAADFNRSREADGKPAVNTLWFWGAGELVRRPQPNFRLVVSDNHLAGLLAEKTATPVMPVPDSAGSLVEKSMQGKTLLVLDALLPFSQKNDYLGWMQQLARYDQQWFRPLKEMALQGKMKTLGILTSSGECFFWSSRHRWRFWRRHKHLGNWIRS